jgi:arylsulfatase A-like enzyme
MPQSNILVLVIDGLRASALGAYGNTTYATPALDHLATESLVLDACYAPAVELADVYSALWQSRIPKWATNHDATNRGISTSLPRILGDNSYHTTLVTDDSQLLHFESADDFLDCVRVDNVNSGTSLAVDLAETSLAALFATAGEVMQRRSKTSAAGASEHGHPQLIWLHTRGFFGPWDAPLHLQECLRDTDDPPPIQTATPPDFQLGNNDDPDIAYQYGVAYAAQVMVMDECWRNLNQLLPPNDATEQWLVLLIGGRGYCLGEHQRIGGIDPHLPAEQLHVPWLIKFPNGRGRLARSSALVSHFDVVPTLLDWIGLGEFTKAELAGASILPLATQLRANWRTTLMTMGREGAYSIRNSSWTLRGRNVRCASQDLNSEQSLIEEDESPQLFVRPDDRWEANDVAKLCPEVVDELQAAVATAFEQLQTGEVPSLLKLPD